LSIKEICTNALVEIGGVEVPSSFVGSGNLTAKQCLALLLAGGKSIERTNRWSALIDTYTFTTVANQASYDLPSDFRAFANMSQWDRTFNRPMMGPTPALVWQFMKSGIAQGATIDRWFRIQGGKFFIHPTPQADGDTIAFDYYSKNWIIKQSDNSYVNTFFSDNDEVRIEEDLLTLDLKWRFLQAKGFPFEAEYKIFEATRDECLADDGGKGRINLGKRYEQWTGIPDTGFGGGTT
jgi:hypothetical protein